MTNTSDGNMNAPVVNISTMVDALFKRADTLYELSAELTERLDQVTHAQQDASEVAGPGLEQDCPLMNHLQSLTATTNRTIGKMRSILDTLAL